MSEVDVVVRLYERAVEGNGSCVSNVKVAAPGDHLSR